MQDKGGNLVSTIKNPWGGNLDIWWDTKGAAGNKYSEDSSWNI